MGIIAEKTKAFRTIFLTCLLLFIPAIIFVPGPVSGLLFVGVVWFGVQWLVYSIGGDSSDKIE